MAKQAKENKYVYYFGGKKAEGTAEMKKLQLISMLISIV